MTTPKPDAKLDLYKDHKDEYTATKTPRIVRIGAAKYLEAQGRGKPGGPEFQDAIGALYSAAYTLKFLSKAKGRDYKVCGLEGLWETDRLRGPVTPELLADLPWRLVIRVPGFTTKADLAAAGKQLVERRKVDIRGKVSLKALREGTCVQALHVGPYADEWSTIETMHAAARAAGYEPAGLHHEIYRSDPRRVPPARLRTILRHTVRRPPPARQAHSKVR